MRLHDKKGKRGSRRNLEGKGQRNKHLRNKLSSLRACAPSALLSINLQDTPPHAHMHPHTQTHTLTLAFNCTHAHTHSHTCNEAQTQGLVFISQFKHFIPSLNKIVEFICTFPHKIKTKMIQC